jgi:hypothetical protein
MLRSFSRHAEHQDRKKLCRTKQALLALSLLTSSGSPVVAQHSQYIALTDQKAGDPQILLMNYAQADWSESNHAAVVWSWRPSESGISTLGWGLPTEAKLRNSPLWGGQWMAVSDSYGIMAVVSYPGKVKKWSVAAGRSANVHGIELLPNGNIAAAASTGGWVRIYTSSQGPSSATYAQYNLPDAHSVLWDPQRQVLWALGRNKLVQLKISGTDAAPSLSAVATTILLADSGHDVEPKYGDPSKLWITTGGSTWIYDKTTDKATLFQRVSGYKSINNQPANLQVIETRPHSSCTQDAWCTDTIEFYSPDDVRTRLHAAIYRARIWNADYQ